ncbi:MAG TPA: DNA alkylation repair protein [Verrucomicrobiales bacterium]|nr:DNA alkylation repair protein [Verrucomicrobiales bacterium]HIL70120.1 DNA alkylation repair protein [Verrucomicrobiota bacterium]
MPEPFKEFLNEAVVKSLSKALANKDSTFPRVKFQNQILNTLSQLELKARVSLISEALAEHLPSSFPVACKLLLHSLPDHFEDETDGKSMNWMVWPMTMFVAEQGVDQRKIALNTLKKLTCHFSAEFAVRPFLINEPAETLKVFMTWTKDPSEHVRRLVSEGSRPRLPWGEQLRPFVKNPQPLIPLLEALKDDTSEYVRRSVSNHLNDISKDHPELVVKIAEKWQTDAGKNRNRLIRHGCRSLIKQGNKACLKMLGYGKPELKNTEIRIHPKKVSIGDSLVFRLSVTSTAEKRQDLIIDYRIHWVKSGGRQTTRVFKWKNLKLISNQSVTLNKKHSLNPVTVRNYYPGIHRVEILINGLVVTETAFNLV